ncbi:MAG: cobalamin biosynthesis protein [Nitrospinota bacterium]
MNNIAFITLSDEGARLVNRLMEVFPNGDGYVHERSNEKTDAKRFPKVTILTDEIFCRYDGLVYIAPCGAVVRAISRHIKDKKTDPAVVQMDVGGRYAVSLLSGHEGGANELAFAVGNAVGADPVISTTVDAAKNIIVGVGCRKGKEAVEIVRSVTAALEEAGLDIGKVRLMASADVKSKEDGLIAAAKEMKLPLRFIPSDDIRSSTREFAHSEFVSKSVNLPAVAEPAALLAGRRTTLIKQKQAYDGITVAIAKENSLSLG